MLRDFFFFLLLGKLSIAAEKSLPWQSLQLKHLTGTTYRPSEQLFYSLRLAKKDGKCPIDEPCKWRNIRCLDGRIIIMEWDGRTVSPKTVYNYRWAPHSLQRINWSSQELNTNLQTRFLPKDLSHLSIRYCGLIGTMDFSTLPQHMAEIYGSGNKFSGTFLLTSLPSSMRCLHMPNNQIEKVVLDNVCVPDIFVEAMFYGNDKHMRLETTDGQKPDKRFYVQINDRYFKRM